MTGAPKHDREDVVLCSFLTHLRLSGRDAVLVEQPDRLPEDMRTLRLVTTDGLFEVRDEAVAERWAVDVTALALPDTWHPALEAVHDHFARAATDLRVDISIEGTLPEPSDVRDLAARTATEVRRQRQSGKVELADDLVIRWEPKRGNCGTVYVVVDMPMPSADLVEQIKHTLAPTLLKKSQRQGRRAKAAGVKYILLLDWLGHDGIAQGTHWLPKHPSTVQTAARDLVEGLTDPPDALFLLTRDGTWLPIWNTNSGGTVTMDGAANDA